MTRRLRTWRLPVALYSRQSASASSAETRRLVVDVEGFMRDCAPKRYRLQGSGGRLLYRAGTRSAFITDLGYAVLSAVHKPRRAPLRQPYTSRAEPPAGGPAGRARRRARGGGARARPPR